MIIDEIMDIKDGQKYDAYDFYTYVNDLYLAERDETALELARALDGGTNADIQNILCNYVIKNGYKHSLCYFIQNFNWLQGC